MKLFELVTTRTIPDAGKAQAKSSTAQNGTNVRFIAGGTNLIDCMKLNVERPKELVDINGLPLDRIREDSGRRAGNVHPSRGSRL
jgi:xanthine dehydrogenase YagS FAD-binding subunit